MSKGSGQRPAAVSPQELAAKWAQTFGGRADGADGRVAVEAATFGPELLERGRKAIADGLTIMHDHIAPRGVVIHHVGGFDVGKVIDLTGWATVDGRVISSGSATCGPSDEPISPTEGA